MSAQPQYRLHASLEDILCEARERIQVTDPELAEARERRNAIGAALLEEFPGSRIYVNGSVAHGDALTPLTDVDVGVVVLDAERTHGPGKRGPADLQERAANAIRKHLKEKYGDLAVEVKGRKRSILVRFRDPVSPGQPDFTADVIVAVDYVGGVGLWIPRYDSWDRSAPEQHTTLVAQANKKTRTAYAHVVRLLKHYNRRNGKVLCTWHIKALALGCLTSPTPQLTGLRVWFEHAIAELSRGETPDPAGVATEPIKTNVPRTGAVGKLRKGLERLGRAIELENAGYGALAHDELAKLFNDEQMLPRPDQDAVRAEEAARVLAAKERDTKRIGAPALLTGVGVGAAHPRSNGRSWGTP
jgi:predicted nucleotidyltransferase